MFKSGIVHGTVKFFDKSKGFGIIIETDIDDQQDVFIGREAAAGWEDKLDSGANITASFFTSERGLAVSEIQSVEMPTETIKGRVKFFDHAKGFGFVTCKGGDVRITTEDLGDFADSVHSGTPITLVVSAGGKGRRNVIRVEAVQVVPTSDQFHIGKVTGVKVQKGNKFGFVPVVVNGQKHTVYLSAKVALAAGTDIWNGLELGVRYEIRDQGLAAIEVCAPDEVEVRNAEDDAMAAE